MSNKHQSDDLGTRMKRYESTSKNQLLHRTPVIARIDGRAFHTFSKRFPPSTDTPFSVDMHNCMVYTMRQLARNVQGCVLGYTQSDEISLLIRDWDTLTTQPFFNYNVQKMTSLMGSIASVAFNFILRDFGDIEDFSGMAQFDARVHNIPKEEVVNYFIWRQQDASRNSVQMFGHHFFSQSRMHGLKNSEVQDLLMMEKGINWNDVPIWMKRGTCIFPPHLIDREIPIFTQDRSYIQRLLEVENGDE